MGRIAMVTLMLSGFVFVETTIHAMAIVQFDAMADEDKSRFIADLVEGAQTVLTADGHIEQAARVERLFNEVLHRDQKSVGFVQLQNNIALARC